MQRDDRDGIVLSVTLHLLVLLLLAVALRVPPEALDPDWPPTLTEIEFGPAPDTAPDDRAPRARGGRRVVGRDDPAGARAADAARRDARAHPRTGRRPPRARTGRSRSRPRATTRARPGPARPPGPPSRSPRPTAPTQPTPTQGTGTSQGDSPTTGSASGAGSGSGGDAAVEVGFQFGTRSFDCPTPPFGGVVGEVVHPGHVRPERPLRRRPAQDPERAAEPGRERRGLAVPRPAAPLERRPGQPDRRGHLPFPRELAGPVPLRPT